MKMKTNKYIAIVFSLFAFSLANASENSTYVDGSKPFIEIKDVNRQGEAWAICAASYDIIAEIFKSQPAQSKQFSEFANGAELAVGMTLVLEAFDSEISPERFNSLWRYSRLAMKEWPTVQLTAILADAERLGAEGYEGFVDKVAATVKICISNLESQQAYIDSWRVLAKSGLLKLPENLP